MAPAIFAQFFQSPEDYYITSFLRTLRFGSFFLYVYVSAIHLSLITHH